MPETENQEIVEHDITEIVQRIEVIEKALSEIKTDLLNQGRSVADLGDDIEALTGKLGGCT